MTNFLILCSAAAAFIGALRWIGKQSILTPDDDELGVQPMWNARRAASYLNVYEVTLITLFNDKRIGADGMTTSGPVFRRSSLNEWRANIDNRLLLHSYNTQTKQMLRLSREQNNGQDWQVGDSVWVDGLPLAEPGAIVRIEGWDVSVRGKIQPTQYKPLVPLAELTAYTFRTRRENLTAAPQPSSDPVTSTVPTVMPASQTLLSTMLPLALVTEWGCFIIILLVLLWLGFRDYNNGGGYRQLGSILNVFWWGVTVAYILIWGGIFWW